MKRICLLFLITCLAGCTGVNYNSGSNKSDSSNLSSESSLYSVDDSSSIEKEFPVIKITDKNGVEHNLLNSTTYNEYIKNPKSTELLFSYILNELISYEYENPNEEIKKWNKLIDNPKEIEGKAIDQINALKNNAKEEASYQGLSYEEVWKKVLNYYGCEDEDDLLNFVISQFKLEDFADKYFNQFRSSLTTEWIGVTSEGEAVEQSLSSSYPYHVKHIIVPVYSRIDDFATATISEEQAQKLGRIMESLLNESMTFSGVAYGSSADYGSARNGGDLGIMTTSTSFVNEFKLGIYAFDALYNHVNDKANNAIKSGFGIDNDYKVNIFNKEYGIEEAWTSSSGINSGKIAEVPFDVFLKLNEYASVTTDEQNKIVNDGNERYYPRNVLFNYYLNLRNPFVITKESIDENSGLPVGSNIESSRFATVELNNGAKQLLIDEMGNIIVGCRSEHGIHLISIERSVFDYASSVYSWNSTLEEYYTTCLPNEKDYPKEEDGRDKDTYVSDATGIEQSAYRNRSNEIKNSILSNDPYFMFRIYEYILEIEKDNLFLEYPSLVEQIDNFINLRRNGYINMRLDNLHYSWKEYTELVARQYENRVVWDDVLASSDNIEMIHPRCAIGFKNHNDSAWDYGGVCYYEKYY